jgi:hypothetical protein
MPAPGAQFSCVCRHWPWLAHVTTEIGPAVSSHEFSSGLHDLHTSRNLVLDTADQNVFARPSATLTAGLR